MKKIITMVGTSLFENYLEKNQDDSLFKNYYEHLKNKEAKEIEEEKDRINRIKAFINQWLSSKNIIRDASAEIKSLIKLKQFLKDDFEIYLFESGTILSKVAGEILKEILAGLSELNESKVYSYIIENLQVKNKDRFRSGMVNLINKTYQIANEYWGNIIFNITGGFKATLPYLTILAQVNRCPIYYIFEESDTLLNIPYIPIDIRWEIFEKYKDFFSKLESEGAREIKGIESKDYGEVNSLLEKVDDIFSLNPLGIILWKRYKQRYSIFYISEFVREYIEDNRNYEKIAEKSFLELKKRYNSNPNDPDLNHGLTGVNLEEFKCFKHKEENLQVRILYKTKERTTTYQGKEIDLYLGLLRIGKDVHNVESEYIKDFKNNLEKIRSNDIYKAFKIKMEVEDVS